MVASLPIKETVLLPIYNLQESLITTNRANEIDEACPSSMTPIVRYLSSEELLDNRVEAHKIEVLAARFLLVNSQLYKRSLDGPYLKCLTHQQGQYVLAELHDEVCGNHPSGKTLAHKAHIGYYWITMRTDAVSYVRKCDCCQRQAPVSKVGLRPNDHNEPLALRLVGNGHRRATAYRPDS